MSKLDEAWKSRREYINGIWVIQKLDARDLLAAFAADLLAKLEEKDKAGNLPCPFCGEKLTPVGTDFGPYYEHKGNNCWLGGMSFRQSEIEGWNTRHIDGEIREIQEEWINASTQDSRQDHS